MSVSSNNHSEWFHNLQSKSKAEPSSEKIVYCKSPKTAITVKVFDRERDSFCPLSAIFFTDTRVQVMPVN